MSLHRLSTACQLAWAPIAFGLAILAGLALGATSQAADPPVAGSTSTEKRVIVGKCYSPQGSLFQKEESKSWKLLDTLDAVYSLDRIVALPGGRATVVSRNGAIRLALVGNLPEFAQVPALESAAVLHDSTEFDADLSLKTGRVEISNRKESGAARVRFRLAQQTWEVTLAAPGDKAVVEQWGRWPQDVTFSSDPKATESPNFVDVLCALQGKITLKVGSEQILLSPPPGVAIYYYESDRLGQNGPKRLEKLPSGLDPVNEAKTERKAARRLVDQLGEDMQKTGLPTALTGLLKSAELAKDKAQTLRDVAIYSMGALDELGMLIDALTSRGAAERSTAVAALRHWIGQDAKRDMRLYQFLIKDRKYAETHAEIVLRLLHSFSESDLARPETYDALIGYLRHEKLPIRELASWHLTRIVPESKIAYDPAGPEPDREKAVKEWKELIPDGKLPPKVKP